MPVQPIPLTGANRNADQGMQDSLGWELFNGIVDELGNFRRVPGYTSFADLSTGNKIDGLWYNEKNDVCLAISNQKVFYVEEDGTTTNITNTGIPALGTPVTFADFADTVYAANGVQIVKIPVDKTTLTSFVTDADAPTDATHVANLNTYLLSNNGVTGRVDFADAGDPDTWSGQFFTFEASNDQLQFMGVGDGYDRIAGFGTKSVESWRNVGDVNVPFIPEGQEYTSRGAISQYSPVWVVDSWYFIDQYKNLCRLSGRNPQQLPTSNSRGLTAFLEDKYLEDAVAFWVYANGYHWYVCNLPTEEITFAYNVSLDQWAQWSYYDATIASHLQFRGCCSAYATGWQKTLIGDSRAGIIYQMSASSFTHNSEAIKSSITTGFLSRGSESRTKFCSRITGRVKKKNVNSDPGNLKVRVEWRDKLLENAWRGVDVDLYKEDDQNYYYYVNGLGSYQRRQWRISVTSDIDFQMSPPEEEFDYAVR